MLAPHPDDEVLGAAGLIQEAQANGADVRVMFLTLGDRKVQTASPFAQFVGRQFARIGLQTRFHTPGLREGNIRLREAISAAGILAIPESRLTFFGYPDSFTLRIWTQGWGAAAAFTSRYTRASAVPYKRAKRPGAPYRPDDMLRDIQDAVAQFRPTIIAVSHPADFNPDHRALYLITRAAIWSVGLPRPPLLLPYLVHYPGWPNLEAPAEWPEALTGLRSHDVALSPERRERKRLALLAHRSQNIPADAFLLSLVDAVESYSDFEPVRLGKGKTVALRDLGDRNQGPAHAHKLTDEERAAYVPLDWASFAWRGDALEISLRCPLPLKDGVALAVSVQGYRQDKPFPDMPKIFIGGEGDAFRAEDRGKEMSTGFQSKRTPDGVTLTMEWKALGDPERAFVSAQTYVDGRISAAVGARVVER